MTRTLRQIEQHRKREAVIEVRDAAGRPCAGLPTWAEQESHEFHFGCVPPDPADLDDADRARCRARFEEVFNRPGPAPDAFRVDVRRPIHLGTLRRELDRLANVGRPLEVHVGGRTVGLAERDERDGARRVADLYTLCFAHSAVWGVVWFGLCDGAAGADGLLRRDLSPKPAYRALQKLIGIVWHSRAVGQTDADGRFAFRGFPGTYRVGAMTANGMALVRSVHLAGRPPGSAAVRLVLG